MQMLMANQRMDKLSAMRVSLCDKGLLNGTFMDSVLDGLDLKATTVSQNTEGDNAFFGQVPRVQTSIQVEDENDDEVDQGPLAACDNLQPELLFQLPDSVEEEPEEDVEDGTKPGDVYLAATARA